MRSATRCTTWSSDPVEKTFDDFVALGRALRENGRFPVVRPSLQVAGLRLLQWQSSPHALVSAEVVPFRPHRGVVLIVEEPIDGRPDEWLQWLHAEHYPALLATPGTAGAWTFGSSTGWSHLPRGWRTDHQYITVVYLDDDPLTTTDALAPLIEERWRSAAVRPFLPGRCAPWSIGRPGGKPCGRLVAREMRPVRNEGDL